MRKMVLLASASPLLAAVILAGAARAQQTAAQPTDPTSTPAQTTLGEIVVTAQHRSETLQHAAIPIDAVSGSELVKNNITDSTQLGQQAPGLIAPAFGGGTVSYFIRGVGNFEEEPFGDPAIAFNYDGVYIGLPAETAQPFYDLQRVEVLKGPQGTLYGRNATGGAINVIPQTPQLGSYGGYFTASYGNYDAYDVQGAVNIPTGAESAFRVAGDVIGHDGYLSDGTSDEDTKSVRAQFLTHPASALSIRLAADYTDVGGIGTGAYLAGDYMFAGPAGYIFQSSGLSPRIGPTSPASEAFLQTLSGAPSGRNLPGDLIRPFTDNRIFGASAEITYDTGAGVLTLIPAWRAGDINFAYGTIGTSAVTKENVSQTSIEARFAGRRIGMFDYSFGAIYFHQTQEGIFVIDQGPIDVFQNYKGPTDSYAGFGRVTAHFSDSLRLVGGFRYTVDDKQFQGVSEALTIICPANPLFGCPNAPAFPFSLSPQGQPLPVPPVSGGILPIPGTGAIVSRADTVVPPSSLTDRAPTFRVALEYDVRPRSLLYASVETGYRSGGFNLANNSATIDDSTYKPEYITAFTVGSKNRFFENRLEINGELFLWKYRDQQVSHLTVDAAGQTNNIVQNVGESTNEGAELEGRFLITPVTVFTTNLQYLDAQYDRFTYVSQSASGLPPTTGCGLAPLGGAIYSVDCSGKPSFNAPKWTLNFGLEQTIPIETYRLVASANTQYLSSRYVGFDFLPQELAPAVWQSNAQLALSPDDGRWDLMLFVQNIEGTRYPVNIARLPTGNFLADTTTPPRLYGVRLNVKF